MMPKFAANLTMLFTEVPFLERFERAAQAGFSAVEFLFPYDFQIADLQNQLKINKLQVILHNLPAGNWSENERGIACHPDRIDEFRAGVKTGMTYAKALGAQQLNCLAGKIPENLSFHLATETFIDNLRYVASEFKKQNLRLLIEPINHFDIPKFYLNKTEQAAEIIRLVDADNLFIQYDIYHAQRMEGELANTIQKYLKLIKHIQISDNPGRNEPGTGEINYPFVFSLLDKIEYSGWVGCEYKPLQTTEIGLSWLKSINKK